MILREYVRAEEKVHLEPLTETVINAEPETQPKLEELV